MNRFFQTSLMIFICSIVASGCATLKPAPFEEYARTVNIAQTALDRALSLHYDWVRSGFIENFQGKFSELVIQPGLGYEWSMSKMPLHLTIKKARTSLLALNNAYADYTALLVKLAKLEVGKAEDFDELTQQLNSNANAALKVTKAELSEENTAIISVAALEAARIYLRSKHLNDLEKVIRKNQPQVESYAAQCIALVHTLRSTLKTYYVDKYEPLKRNWEKSNAMQRTELVEAMMTLDESFIDTLRLLLEIEMLYQNLPKAHADLAKPVEDARWHANRQGLDRLIESGQRLKYLYDELKPKDQK